MPLTSRHRAYAIELQKGEDAIGVQTVTELAETLRTVREAIPSEELDELLAKYAQYGRAVKR
jgi:hypothetical protein